MSGAERARPKVPPTEAEGQLASRMHAPLPRGRHGLSPEYVAAHQRARLLRAVCEVCAARGYAEATVAEIVRAAGVSQRAFYRHFDGKQECFLAAWRDAAEEIEARVLAALASPVVAADLAAADARVALALRALLQELAAHPALARMLFVDVLFAGSRALRAREQALARCRAALPAPAQ
ncbi:MAG TPA: helix-turn-helix domain-containing protein, partial [Methylomirabilota bacterium]|nr:helix-turn-helix domain-containing protein [Methylomirabilota bacterium]